jgi:predicted XRE-type DNA-binding protein
MHNPSQRTIRHGLALATSRFKAMPSDARQQVMKKRTHSEHGPRHVSPAGRSVFRDLFPAAEAEEREIRSALLMGLERWLEDCGMTQTQAAKVLGVTQARISNLKRGKINLFSLDLLIRLAARAGLRPRLKLAA